MEGCCSVYLFLWFGFFLLPWDDCTAARTVSIARKLQAYIFDIVVFLRNISAGHKEEGNVCDT
jgi:hypothetical protein